MSRYYDLATSGHQLETARRNLDIAMRNAADDAKAAASDGMPETKIAEFLGVNRLTVRRWLGK